MYVRVVYQSLSGGSDHDLMHDGVVGRSPKRLGIWMATCAIESEIHLEDVLSFDIKLRGGSCVGFHRTNSYLLLFIV